MKRVVVILLVILLVGCTPVNYGNVNIRKDYAIVASDIVNRTYAIIPMSGKIDKGSLKLYSDLIASYLKDAKMILVEDQGKADFLLYIDYVIRSGHDSDFPIYPDQTDSGLEKSCKYCAFCRTENCGIQENDFIGRRIAGIMHTFFFKAGMYQKSPSNTTIYKVFEAEAYTFDASTQGLDKYLCIAKRIFQKFPDRSESINVLIPKSECM